MYANRVLNAGILAGAVIFALGSTGCSSMNNTEKDTAVGGAIGTGAGLAIGALTHSPATGAVVGGLLGAGTGAVIGSEKDAQDRHDYAVQQTQAAAAAQAQAQAQAQQRMLGMADVIRLSQSGMDDQLIINQIRSSGSAFQLTVSDLEYLQKCGVSQRVIAEMQVARAQVIAVPGGPPGAPVYVDGGPTVVVAPRPYGYPYGYYGGGYYGYGGRRGW